MFEDCVDLVNDFVVESRDGLEGIDNQLLAIEASGDNIDTDKVNEVFRAIHSIKGASGFLGLDAIGKLSHSLENILDLLRNGKFKIDAHRTGVMLTAIDKLKDLIDNVHTSNEIDVSEQIGQLEQLLDSSALAPVADIAPPVTTTFHHCCTEEDFQSARENKQNIFDVNFDLFHSTASNVDVTDFITRLGDLGKVLGGYLDTVSLLNWDFNHEDSPLPWIVTLATQLDQESLSRFFLLPEDNIQSVLPPEIPQEELVVSEQVKEEPSIDTFQKAGSESVPEQIAEMPPKPTAAKTTSAAAPVADSSIRVSVTVLNQLMNLVGELVLGRNQLLQAVGSENDRTLVSVASRIDQVTSEVQEAVMKTRLQPIGNVFNKFTRVVRDLSQKLNKQCELEIKGKDVELDKTIIEGISDPLTHLIRNAVDHGMELPQVRQERGKPTAGKISLNAFHQEGKVNIIISDDGAGIDADRLRQKAIEKGILTPAQGERLSKEDAVKLIFHPGFSTAEKVSDVSGRGVGMDVVRTNFEQLGGTVDVETAIGVGTKFTVRLPLTLAIVPSLVVSSNGNRFAIPQMSVSELVRLQRSDWKSRVETVRGARLLRLRGELLPLVDLHTSTETNELPESISIVVLNYGECQFGLIVDALHDTEEIVVKPLGRHIKNVPWLAGATILGDGQIAFIIDVAGLANLKRIDTTDCGEQKESEDDWERDSAETLEALLIANHPDEQFAIPISHISRIEKISPSEIEAIDGREVMRYRGESLPLLSLEKFFHTRPIEFDEEIFVVVCQIFREEVGLVAPNVFDTYKIGTELDTETLRAEGLLGSTIVNETTTRVLDIFEMTRKAFPHMIPQNLSEACEESPGGRLVLAEDSNFFRSKMKQFLEEEHWTVVDFEDGAAAWNYLQETEDLVDLVITDIEMPNMDGFEFCEQIRASQKWNTVPVIAVTSLADNESQERSQRVGITEHMIKLDRAKLIETLAHYYHSSSTL